LTTFFTPCSIGITSILLFFVGSLFWDMMYSSPMVGVSWICVYIFVVPCFASLSAYVEKGRKRFFRGQNVHGSSRNVHGSCNNPARWKVVLSD